MPRRQHAVPVDNARSGIRAPWGKNRQWRRERYLLFRRCRRTLCLGLGTNFLSLRDPALNSARQPDLLTDIVGGFRSEFGNLPIMEDAEIVEFFLDRRRNAGQFLEI